MCLYDGQDEESDSKTHHLDNVQNYFGVGDEDAGEDVADVDD